MPLEYQKFNAVRSESLPPDDEKAGDIFSRLGYKISDAIADLVDNSVDAEAKKVLIRFVRTSEGVHSVIIADNGKGMDGKELKEAMRFGSHVKKDKKQLGKYGIGLKSASLSQAETVTVLSCKVNSFVGRKWTLENIKNKWQCDILNESDVKEAFKIDLGRFKISRSGTIIIWERLEHLRALPHNLDRVLEKTTNELSVELGIRFHRFIEKSKLEISIDQQYAGEEEPKVQRLVSALNPFSYPASGRKDYPAIFNLKINKTKVAVKCHIWPAKSSAIGYRLGGGKVALRQGFYFYRNDRVIQAGGWNGVRADDSEPHLSLARVEIDLPGELDSMFKLDVTKSHLDPSPQFIQALLSAEKNGIRFEDYIKDAVSAYRKKKNEKQSILIPGKGFTAKASRAITQILSEKSNVDKEKVGFSWKRLDYDEIFRINEFDNMIYLNSIYKSELVEGKNSDAPVLKTVLMFLLQNELKKTRRSKATTSWLQQLNMALIASLKSK